MKKALMIAAILFAAVVSTACINNIAVQELNNKAAEFMQKGDYESAMNRLQASLDLDASVYQTYYNLGIAAMNAKKYDKAIEALEGGIKINPDYFDFYYSLGLAQYEAACKITENDNEEESVSEEDKAKAAELNKKAAENLSKYLEMNPEAKDKETVEALIAEINSDNDTLGIKEEEN